MLIKAVAGGGGKGMRRVDRHAEFEAALESAQREAKSSFGDARVLIEKYVSTPRHVETQVFADAHGNAIHLNERDCSLQRRHQKVIEEAPAPGMTAEVRAAMGDAAVKAAQAVGYVGAGTVEFIADGSKGLRPDAYWFMEMNTRLQVEHPVTEEVTGLDLVELQLRIAEGEPLPPQARAARINGHAIEVRLYAEDVSAGFVPSTGTLHRFQVPAAPGIRVDTGFRDGSVISPYYDAMLAKVIAHGPTRADAARRLARALGQAGIHGVTTNRDLLAAILREPEFLAGGTDTGYLTRHEPAALALPAAGAGDRPVAIHALAAALARQARHRAGAPVLGTLPSGWRNVFSSPQRVSYAVAGEPLDVTYRICGDRADAEVDGVPVRALVHSATPDRVDLEIDGTRRVYRMHTVGADTFVDASDGSSALSEIPRFGDPTKLAPAGSLLAPMPGLVLRVLAEPGAVVTAGQPLLVLEAMKMEQTVSAPADGVVAELRAKAGEQVSTGQVLAVLEAKG